MKDDNSPLTKEDEILKLNEKQQFKGIDQIIKEDENLAKKAFMQQKSINSIKNAEDLFLSEKTIVKLIIKYKDKCCQLLEGDDYLVPLSKNYRSSDETSNKNQLLNFQNYKVTYINKRFDFYFNCFVKNMTIKKNNETIKIYNNQNDLKVSLEEGNYTFNLNGETHQIELKI